MLWARLCALGIAGMLAAFGAGSVEGSPRAASDVQANSVRVSLLDARRTLVGTVTFIQRRPGGVTLAEVRLLRVPPRDRHRYKTVLRPGSCSRPASGRGFHDLGLAEVDYAPPELRRTTWSVDLHRMASIGNRLTVTRTACGSHTGSRPLRTNSEPRPSLGDPRREGARVLVEVPDGTVTLTPAVRGSRTDVRIEYAAVNGSSDVPADIRRGTCSRLTPSLAYPFTLVPDAERAKLVPTVVRLPIGFTAFTRTAYVLELRDRYFGDRVGACLRLAPAH